MVLFAGFLSNLFLYFTVLQIRIRDPVLFYPPDPGWSTGRIRIRDKQTKFVNCLYTKVGRIREPGAFLPPGSGIRIRDGAMVGSGSGIKHPGSATLGYRKFEIP
jgi:hypothetical protein